MKQKYEIYEENRIKNENDVNQKLEEKLEVQSLIIKKIEFLIKEKSLNKTDLSEKIYQSKNLLSQKTNLINKRYFSNVDLYALASAMNVPLEVFNTGIEINDIPNLLNKFENETIEKNIKEENGEVVLASIILEEEIKKDKNKLKFLIISTVLSFLVSFILIISFFRTNHIFTPKTSLSQQIFKKQKEILSEEFIEKELESFSAGELIIFNLGDLEKKELVEILSLLNSINPSFQDSLQDGLFEKNIIEKEYFDILIGVLRAYSYK